MLTRRRFLTNSILSAASIGISACFSSLPVARAADEVDIPVIKKEEVKEEVKEVRPAQEEVNVSRFKNMTYEREAVETPIFISKPRQFFSQIKSHFIIPQLYQNCNRALEYFSEKA